MATDVARAAGVSQKTVSRVVNNDPNVSAATRLRVAAAITALGYRPNAAARALVTQQSRVLGVAMPGSVDYGPSAQLFAIESTAWELGYSVVVASAQASAVASSADFERAIGRLVDQGVDGLILANPYVDHGLSPDVLRGIPAVNVGEAVGPAGWPTVTVDQEMGARLAVDHLLRLGHRTVHHLAGPADQGAAVRRVDGWRRALSAAGRDVPEPLVGDWTARSGYELGRALAADPAVTAVFTANDQMAVGAMRAVLESGRAVPADVSVVGFDDSPDAGYQVIPLTTVRQEFAVGARRAVTGLVAAVEGRGGGDGATVRLPVELVVRSSTGPAP
ncbi:LacI family DNA-binding transcriptional regulator [Cellulomonas sp. Marseille-Q8402]